MKAATDNAGNVINELKLVYNKTRQRRSPRSCPRSLAGAALPSNRFIKSLEQTNGSSVQGKIVQCIGAVVDVEFPRDQMPKVYDALKLEGSALTLEVQQQLGDGVSCAPSRSALPTVCVAALIVTNTGNRHHGARGQGDAESHHGRAGQPHRRTRSRGSGTDGLHPPQGACVRRADRPRRNCWKPASGD